MPRVRFEAIFHTFLHASGVDAESKDKIEPFLESMTKSFQQAYYPSKDISIDEMVIGFRGRWKFKQFNSSKPSKYHIKTFGLCESSSGYVYNLFTYYGSETGYHPSLDPSCSQAIKVFEKLLRPLEKGHHIFADRYYTSIPLLEYLCAHGFYYTGTVDVRRKFFPQELKTLRLDYLGMKWFLRQDKTLLTVAFRDKKAKKNCTVVTNDGSVATTEIRRRSGTIHKPTCIDHYNQKMNGCDRADQRVQYYGMHKRKSYKWWKKVFHFILEITVINSSIIFDERKKLQENYTKKMPLKVFKSILIEELSMHIAQHKLAREPPAPVGVVERIATGNHFMESVNKGRNCRVCSKPGKRKRTRNVCTTCTGQPHLCKSNCFMVWHTRLNLC